MRHDLIIFVSSLAVAIVVYLVTDILIQSNQAAVGSLTITGLTAFVLFSAYHPDISRK